jgi:hypothetical protein
MEKEKNELKIYAGVAEKSVYNFETRRNSRKEQYNRNGLRVSNQSLLRHLMGFGDKATKRDRCFSFIIK